MNIGEFVKNIKKEYPSISISKVRFLEKEGFLNPIRSKGGTRNFTNKDIDLVKQILNLQENYFYSLKAIKNDKSLLKSNQKKLKKHKSYNKSEVIKLSGLSTKQFNELVEFNFINTKDTYEEDELESFKSWSYFYFLGLSPKNFALINSVSERLEGFINYLELSLNLDEKERKELRYNLVHLIKGKL